MTRTLFAIAFVALLVLHHDWWFWDDTSLVFGFLPIGLAYHAAVSLAAAGLWAWAVFVAWPEIFREPAEAKADSSSEH